ncbi:MAG: mitofilin family membrane protein [Pseudomonadota bacterium]
MGEPKDPETEGQPKPYAELGGLNAAIAAKREAAGESAAEPAAQPAEAVIPAEAAAESESEAETTASAVEARRANAAPPPEPVAAKGASSGWLALMLGLVVGAVGILIIGPSIAPHLPRPIAEFLTNRGAGPDPAVVALEARIAALEAEEAAAPPDVSEDIATLGSRLDAISDDVANLSANGIALSEDVQALSAAGITLSEDIQTLSAAGIAKAEDVAALSARMAGVTEDIQSLAASNIASGEDVEALHQRILALETSTMPAQLTERINALEAEEPEVTGTEFAGLSETVKGATDRIAAIESGLDDARAKQAEAEAALEQARSDAAQRENAARLRAGGEALRTRLVAGDAFGAILSDLSTLSATTPPAALSDAVGGVVSTDVLGERFPSVAQAALRAELAATGETSNAVFGWLQSQVTVRNTTPREGDDVEAVLSRVGAAIENGDANTALAESTGLPDHAREAMAGWLNDLETRVGAETALDNWLAEIGAASNG